jgi:hypothetical protein
MASQVSTFATCPFWLLDMGGNGKIVDKLTCMISSMISSSQQAQLFNAKGDLSTEHWGSTIKCTVENYHWLMLGWNREPESTRLMKRHYLYLWCRCGGDGGIAREEKWCSHIVGH